SVPIGPLSRSVHSGSLGGLDRAPHPLGGLRLIGLANAELDCAIGAGAARNRLRSNSMSIWLVSKRKLAISVRRRRSWSRPQAPTPLMRLRFGSPIGDGRPVGRPPDTCEEGRFGNILTGSHQASIAAAVHLSTTFDGTLGAHLLHKSDQGRKQVRGPRTNPLKING